MHDAQVSTLVIQVAKLETLQEANTRALSEMATSVGRLVDRLESSDDTAKEAAQSTRSAHKRLDKMEAELKDDKEELKDEMDKMKQNQKYIITTACTLISLGVAFLSFAFKFVQ
ncbi:hypothetical protein M3223_04010 [Paenibacillus pasadenensis]|uniref:hypothetical protein n=1 Tax=Paenibacillus pasadenensis TaxID=217090 RepID=UPI00203EC3FE|nr:hypothetical protein [Paenibacillus pasadenensis]MCM3746513.1 hypothetical protein [Paenibacillus pasadenensis]